MKPHEVLPHRHPFIMPDAVEVVEGGRKAKGKKYLTGDDPAVRPDGTFPEVYIIETMAQVSGIASGKREPSVLAAVNRLTFTDRACAGDVLDVESTVGRMLGGLCIFACRASVSGKTIAEGEVILHFDEAS